MHLSWEHLQEVSKMAKIDSRLVFPGSISDLERMMGRKYEYMRYDTGMPIEVSNKYETNNDVFEVKSSLAERAGKIGASALVHTEYFPSFTREFASVGRYDLHGELKGIGYAVKEVVD